MIHAFSNPVFSHFIVSPLGLREKKTQDKFRVIHDLSAPFGGPLVNSHIPKEAGTVSYDTVDKAISLIQDIGPGAVLAKTDIEHAYKLIPIHPHNIPALGLRWYDDWLWNCTLPMGSKSGCAIFESFSGYTVPSRGPRLWEYEPHVGRLSWPTNKSQMAGYLHSCRYAAGWAYLWWSRKPSQGGLALFF